MSDAPKRDYRLTVRLSDAERATLEKLSGQMAVDKSMAVRRALARALRPELPRRGCFRLTGGGVLPIRLRKGRS